MRKTIMCFGDSNTWGYNPANGERFDTETRWTCRLAEILGDAYFVVEEGLNGRTTAFDDPIEPFRNGRKALEVCLLSHSPIDLFIVMLGTNDTKKFHHLTPFMITKGLESIVTEAGQATYGRDGQPPKVLVVSPISISPQGFDEGMREYFDESSAEKAAVLGIRYSKVAEQYGCGLLDAAKYAHPSERDGIHMEAEQHAALAAAFAESVKAMIG